jgi:hypothetical protein
VTASSNEQQTGGTEVGGDSFMELVLIWWIKRTVLGFRSSAAVCEDANASLRARLGLGGEHGESIIIVMEGIVKLFVKLFLMFYEKNYHLIYFFE